ncbi:DHA2 family efflux MFS transporter permease subunit [Actinoalloteichus hymeniacidonis]|uniref:Drug resistance transporter, EmrB/QacA subfamily n=1 Tax=Actinoalloteichus hymeniacidonis TaxID=340345 RepID=A0AAC9MXL1_9PSEU|nr:DHA2 family efflux MFS transporter permease subunit [Actinoalloteichus hymeniacidonis]AOS62012.1 drug resistance transporter, EmrB/QacA subfamily [Actinoalloteichus hymeniacidonis]MBB5909966.1 EmrB/QacA subfamily drug resistance transporter [Actinoalloteichus hymeniacidonis]
MNQTEPARVKSRWLGLGVLCTGMFMIVTDGTVVNVALPTIQVELGFTQANLAWVINAFLIPFAGLLLLAGRLGDLIGRQRLFLTGLVTFTLASLLCGLAGTQELLIAGRFGQGVAGAMCAGVILGKIVTLFDDPGELGKAFGIFAFVLTSAGAAGLVLGGVLTQLIAWNWIFFINVPVGIATIVLAIRVLDDDRGPGLGRGTDFLGAVLVTSGLMLAVYTLVEIPNVGWGSSSTLGFGAAALALLVGFVVRQAMAANPLMPLRLFRSRNLSGGNILQAVYVSASLGMFFITSLYLQLVLEYTPLQIGMTFLPMTAITAVITLGFAPKLNARYGERRMLIIGLIPIVIGLALLARVPVDGTFLTHLLPSMVLIGGGGLVVPAMTALAMADAPPSDAGLAGALFNTMQQVGGAIGVAVLAAVSTAHTARLATEGTPQVEALTGGYRLGFLVAMGFILLCLAIAVLVLRKTARPVPTDDAAEPAAA